MAATGPKRGRPVALVAAGLPLLAVPERVGELAAGGGARPDPRIVRLLGARMAAQGAALLVRPSAGAWRLAAAVDAAHGSSMVGLAVLSPRYRRPALVSAAVAGVSAWFELATSRRRHA
jgi:hypothetical protein